MNKFNKPSGRTAKKVKRENARKSKKAAGVPQAHKLAVKLQAGKRTGKAARKQARAANRTEAAEKREAVVAAAPADEAMTNAPKLRKPSAKKGKKAGMKVTAAVPAAASAPMES
mmetsp:Transcript_15215/g.45905  ORF Transcript_15215/g.45905 Transcript_15215/m.45905 type:complete len:114 (-) Transcript_15215:3164-3505(-)